MGRRPAAARSGPRVPSRGTRAWLPAAVALVTVLAFAPAVDNGFTDWDDPGYVTENQLIRDLSPGGLKAIFSSYVEGNYHPVTMASLALDYHLWDLNPVGYHAVNVALHVLNALLVFWFVLRLTGSREMSAVSALFFGIHPLHVESVAWVSARKDVLYALFYLGACISYLYWVDERRRRTAHYAAAVGLFVLSLLSKGMATVLPLTLLAIDFYRGRNVGVGRLLLEKAPFFLLSLALGVVAVQAQQAKGAVQDLALFPFHERILFACYGIVAYLVRAVAPVQLSAFYPYPLKTDAGPGLVYLAAPVLVVILAVAVIWTLRRSRDVAFGALFYVLNVALVLQLFPVGSAIVADRYTYVSYVGVGFVLASGYRHLLRTVLAPRPILRAGVLVLVASFGAALLFATRARCEVWRDNISLWTDVIGRYPTLPLAYTMRARSQMHLGQYDSAMADLERALSLEPDNHDALTDRGTIRFLRRDMEPARADLEKAVRLKPTDAVAWNSLGAVHFDAGERERALVDFDRAIELKRGYAEAHLNRAVTLGALGQRARALADYDAHIRLQPGNAKALLWRGATRFSLADTAGAIRDYDEALRIDPNLGEAYFERSRAFEAMGRYDRALQDGLRARTLGHPVEEGYLERLRRGSR